MARKNGARNGISHFKGKKYENHFLWDLSAERLHLTSSVCIWITATHLKNWEWFGAGLRGVIVRHTFVIDKQTQRFSIWAELRDLCSAPVYNRKFISAFEPGQVKKKLPVFATRSREDPFAVFRLFVAFNAASNGRNKDCPRVTWLTIPFRSARMRGQFPGYAKLHLMSRSVA